VIERQIDNAEAADTDHTQQFELAQARARGQRARSLGMEA
jgi:hypothetical protein